MNLIINADDFGLTKSVNKAIIDVFKAGNLTSTTLMVNMPGTEDAVELSKQHPGLAIGLHFCITEGYPLTVCDSLTDEKGMFLTREKLIKQVYLNKINKQEIEQEFLAQYHKINKLGINLTHVDSHQHILQIPFIFESLRKTFDDLKLKVRIVNPSSFQFSLNPKRWPRVIKNYINYRSAQKMKQGYRYAMNDYLVSIHDKLTNLRFNEDIYDRLLLECDATGSVELMVHPYILGEDLMNIYAQEMDTKLPFLKICEREYEVLSGKPLFESFSLINFGNL